jgi:hypothetical protein
MTEIYERGRWEKENQMNLCSGNALELSGSLYMLVW